MNKYFFGIILILLGVGFLLDQTNVIEFSQIISMYWPSIIILIGISGLFERKSSKVGNYIVILLGVLLQLNKLEYLDYNIFNLFWPIILILVGLNIIFSKGVKTHSTNSNPNGDNEKNLEKWSGNITLEDSIDSFVLFSGLETNNQSQEFKGGKGTAVFGAIELDLREAKLYNNEGYMELTSIFGGIEVFVPMGWRVEMSGVPIFGAWSNKTRLTSDSNAPILRIKCVVVFGGIDVK